MDMGDIVDWGYIELWQMLSDSLFRDQTRLFLFFLHGYEGRYKEADSSH